MAIKISQLPVAIASAAGDLFAMVQAGVTRKVPLSQITAQVSTPLAAPGGSALVGFTQAGAGAVAMTAQANMRDWVSVRQFGAACDDTTDDTAAIQAAFDSMAAGSYLSSGMVLTFPGPCKISGTLVADLKSVILQGGGWGSPLDVNNPRRSYLRWAGAAGIPMLIISNAEGFGIRDWRFIGDSANPPSAAINFKEAAAGTISRCFVDNVRVGFYGAEVDLGRQFTHGVLFDGDPTNNSEIHLSRMKIFGCLGDGIHQSAIQQTNHHYTDCMIGRIDGSGVYACGGATLNNVNFSLCATDITIPTLDDSGSGVDAQVDVYQNFSEGSGRMLDKIGSGRVTYHGGQFSISNLLNADGKLIKDDTAGSITMFRMTGMRFFQNSAPPTPPYMAFACGTTSRRHIVIEDVRGWNALMTGGTFGMDVSLDAASTAGRAYVFFREFINTNTDIFLPPRTAQNFLVGNGAAQQWDPTSYETANEKSLRLKDDFLGVTLDTNVWGNHKGTHGGCVAPAIVAAPGGTMQFTTGADAAGTMAANGVQIWSSLIWQVSPAFIFCEARVKASAITDLCLFVGVTDQIAALEMPFTLGAGDVLTSNASDACGWLFDTAADTDNWWLIGVRSNVDAAKQNSALAPVANTFETLRVEITSAGAKFFRNGVQIGTTMAGAILSTTPLTPVIAAFSRGAATRVITSDIIDIQQKRV